MMRADFRVNFGVFSAAVLFCGIISPSFAAANSDGAEVSPDARQVAQWLSGHFDSSEQASKDDDYFNVSLKACIVNVLGSDNEPLTDSSYLYVEQAIAGRELAPYRQRIYRIGDALQDGQAVVESEIMTFADPSSFVGFCSRPQSSRSLPMGVLDERGCSVFLTRQLNDQGETRFAGRTPEGGCPSDFRGAVSVESYVSLGQNELVAWDVGRDAAGQQVWGPEKGPYQFIRK